MASFFSQTFSSINQPKMRQEGFHLPSPSPSTGNPPSPTSAGPFDLFLSQSSHHTQHGANNTSNGSASNDNRFPSLALPDAFSRTSAIDLTDELAMSLMSPATSNERSTHTPPFERQGSHHSTHNIFDISAPSAANFAHLNSGAHAFSLPHTSTRPDLPPISQPASFATHGLHGPSAAFDSPHQTSHLNALGTGREPFPAQFNSTIPPLSGHHESVAHPSLSSPFAPFSPASSAPARDSPSPSNTAGGRNGSRPPTAASGRSPSRSRSRVRAGSVSQPNGVPVPQSAGGGPTRTAKSTSRRRDSFTTMAPHLAHAHSHSHSHHAHHLHTLPSPPLGSASRPQSIVIPPHGVGGAGALSPLGGMSSLGNALSPLGVGQASGWFLPGAGGSGGPSAAQGVGGEFSLPTPESVHNAFGHFGTSVGSMGISPKDTALVGSKDDSPPMDAASKQAAIVNEKRRKRRESHNAVERRRRDNINEKISELATLIPEVLLDPGSSGGTGTGTDDGLPTKEASEDGSDLPSLPSAGSNNNKQEKENNGGVKANKGMILRKSVEYIRYLQQLVSAQAARNRSLEAQLARAGLSATSAADGISPESAAGMLKFASSFNGGLLEPMAEGDAEMEMDLEMDTEGMGMDMDPHHHAHTQFLNGHGLTKRNDLHDSPGASGSDEHDHEHDHDHGNTHHEDDDASNSGSASGSEPPRARRPGSDGSATSTMAERGRRGRAARAVNGVEGRGMGMAVEEGNGLVAVKEEA